MTNTYESNDLHLYMGWRKTPLLLTPSRKAILLHRFRVSAKVSASRFRSAPQSAPRSPITPAIHLGIEAADRRGSLPWRALSHPRRPGPAAEATGAASRNSTARKE